MKGERTKKRLGCSTNKSIKKNPEAFGKEYQMNFTYSCDGDILEIMCEACRERKRLKKELYDRNEEIRQIKAQKEGKPYSPQTFIFTNDCKSCAALTEARVYEKEEWEVVNKKENKLLFRKGVLNMSEEEPSLVSEVISHKLSIYNNKELAKLDPSFEERKEAKISKHRREVYYPKQGDKSVRIAGSPRYNNDYHYATENKDKRHAKIHMELAFKAMNGSTKVPFTGEF